MTDPIDMSVTHTGTLPHCGTCNGHRPYNVRGKV